MNLDVDNSSSSTDPATSQGKNNGAFDSSDFDMLRNEQPVQDTMPDTQTDGKQGDSAGFAPVHVVSMSGGEQEVNPSAASSGQTGSQQKQDVNFRHAQFRGLSASTNGSSAYM